jgi:hypothetical protein
MEKINWIQILIGFVGGGAIGALIKQYFDHKRFRIQPIGKSIEINSLFDAFKNELIESEVILTDENGEVTFQRLYTGKLRLINSGSIDFETFQFGLTLIPEADFIQVKIKSMDRHHVGEIINTKPSLTYFTNEVDIVLRPFNRKDQYIFDFLITSDKDSISKNDITISTISSVRWVELMNTSEMILKVAKESTLKFGPLIIGYH